jgi:hypothetical protein
MSPCGMLPSAGLLKWFHDQICIVYLQLSRIRYNRKIASLVEFARPDEFRLDCAQAGC